MEPFSSTLQVHKTAFRELMKDTHTSIPGHVLTFDPVTQTAQIQIGIERTDINGAVFTPPPLVTVPVMFHGGDFSVEFAVTPGCEGWIFFSQRCIDGWFNTGGVAANPIARFHDASDACFVPGTRSLPNVLPDFQNNGIRIRNRSGSQYVWLKSDNTIQANNGAGSIVIGANGTVTINGVVTIDTAGNIITPKDVKASTLHTDTASMTASGVSTTQDVVAGSISLKTHRHTGITTGSGTSGTPV